MIIHLVFFLLFYLHSHPFLTGALNISDFLPPPPPPHPHPHPHPSLFLQDVLKAIAVSQRWDIQSLKVSKLENLSYGYSNKDEFFAKIPKNRNLVLRLSHHVDSWKNFRDDVDFEELFKRLNSQAAVLRPFQVHGPCVLVVAPNASLSLQFPKNKTFSGLKQICIGEGITVEVKGAQEVTFGMSSCNSELTNRNNQEYKGGINFWSFPQPLHPIHVVGSSYVTPFNFSTIQHRFVARDILELMPEKCYTRFIYRKPPCPLNPSSRVVALKHLLKSIFGEFHQYQNRPLSLYKACIRASTIVHFQLDLRRDVETESSRQEGKLAKWRTQPLVQRCLFDVVATLDNEKLKPLKVKMVRPFNGVDSGVWGELSNVSFTKYSNVLVPPLPLTLDVKW